MKATPIPYEELVFNYDFYPRSSVDQERVGQLAAVLESGRKLPAIIVDKKHRVVDGFHRARAHRLLHGTAVQVPCEVHEYANDAAFLLDAIARNAQHGKPLSNHDHEHCVALAQKHGVAVEELATVLSVRVERVTSLAKTKPLVAGGHRGGNGIRAKSTGTRLDYGDMTAFDLNRDAARVGLHQLNAVLVAIQNGTLDIHDRRVNQSLRNLVKVALERLKEEQLV